MGEAKKININRFNTTTSLCLTQARIYLEFNGLMCEVVVCFVDICGICWSSLFSFSFHKWLVITSDVKNTCTCMACFYLLCDKQQNKQKQNLHSLISMKTNIFSLDIHTMLLSQQSIIYTYKNVYCFSGNQLVLRNTDSPSTQNFQILNQ